MNGASPPMFRLFEFKISWRGWHLEGSANDLPQPQPPGGKASTKSGNNEFLPNPPKHKERRLWAAGSGLAMGVIGFSSPDHTINATSQELVDSPYQERPANTNENPNHQVMWMAISPVPESPLLGQERLSSNPTMRLLAKVHPTPEHCAHYCYGSNAADQLSAHC
jgi:hypothetical protein